MSQPPDSISTPNPLLELEALYRDLDALAAECVGRQRQVETATDAVRRLEAVRNPQIEFQEPPSHKDAAVCPITPEPETN